MLLLIDNRDKPDFFLLGTGIEKQNFALTSAIQADSAATGCKSFPGDFWVFFTPNNVDGRLKMRSARLPGGEGYSLRRPN